MRETPTIDLTAAAGLFVCLLFSVTGCVREGTVPEGAADPASARQWEGEVSSFPRVVPEELLSGRSFREAPMLAGRVDDGRLPGVSERLPGNPLVVYPINEIGVYGGVIRRASSSDVGYENAVKRTLSENLMAWARPIPDAIEFNLAEHYEFLDDGRTIHLRLREGIRWSDGHPFTVDDILFWYEDIMLDDEARPAHHPFFPAEWTVDGTPLEMRKEDSHTLVISGGRPLGRILEVLTGDEIAVPKHVFAPHHPRYNPEVNYADFRRITTDAQLTFEPGIPRLSAWAPVEWHKGQRVIYERNPYYWKIDPEGNQLPYADRLVFNIIPNPEIRLFKFINGEIDILGDISMGSAYPTLRAYERTGRFTVRYSPPRPFYALVFNWDTPNRLRRAAFRNRNVRIALSHAINREEINQLLGHGLLVPAGYALGPDSPLFREDQFYRFAAFDPREARRLLDAEGYVDRNGDGYRQFPDGSRFEVTIDMVTDRGVGPAFMELVMEYWEDIGVRCFLNLGHNNIIMERRTNATFEVLARRQPSNMFDQSQHFAIIGPNLPFWHPRATEEGPAWLLEATEHLHRAMGTIDPEERIHYGAKVRDLHVENIPMVSLGAQREIYVSNKRVGNVPPTAVLDTSYRGWERPLFHEQMYIMPGASP